MNMLAMIIFQTSKIFSICDAVVEENKWVTSVKFQPEIGYTFANGLRSILRQDPDIIMVGEIRDGETAKLAVQASLTGHLVFATLHTNNTTGVIPRLIDMGVEPYLIPATLIMAVAQRLVPTLCQDSKEAIQVEGGIKTMIDKELSGIPARTRQAIKVPTAVYRARRSAICPGGTKGRIAVFEVMEMTRELEKVILTNPSDAEIYRVTRENGLVTMREDALLKVFEGIVPLEEVSKL